MTLRDLIKLKTKEHLDNNGIICCQNITGVGALQNTFPIEYTNHPGVVELPTSDVSNSGIAVGMALSGRRVIYVIRFAGFLWLNGSNLVNYAAKSKELWDVSCPIFIRTMGTEGGIGPVASHSHHSMIAHMPGIAVFAPITPLEYEETWQYFMAQENPVLCSEHRATLSVDYELADIINDDAKFTIFAISYARLNALKTLKLLNFPCNLIHIKQLKPFTMKPEYVNALKKSGHGIVVDTDFEICGMSQSLAYNLMLVSGVPVVAYGLEDRTAGFSVSTDNCTPSPEKIAKKILDLVKNF